MSNEPDTPDLVIDAEGECLHLWEEDFYGWRCAGCDSFIPFGCEPWAPDDEWPPVELGGESGGA